MKSVTESIKVELIDYGPVYKNFIPDKILAVSGILTAKKGDFTKMLESLSENAVKKFHEEATKRGHASLLTTPIFYFWIEGSRVIDFFLTSFPFGSYLMFSSRRIEISMDNIVIPDAIKNSEYKNEYEKICKELLKEYKNLLKFGYDQARNILPLGFTSYGFFSFPAQTILTCINECKRNKAIPEELKIISNEFEKILKLKTSYIFENSEKAYETGYTFPNIFGDYEILENECVEVIYKGDIRKILELYNKSVDWKKISQHAQLEIFVKVVSFISLAGWNEIKRHRTVKQFVEPIYKAIERYLKNPKEEYFHIPPNAGKSYKEAFHNAIAFYEKLIKSGVEKKHALYIIPHALKVKFKLILDGYNLLDPFGFIGIRSCSTTHYEVRRFAEKISENVTKAVPELKNLIAPKCKIGICPEKNCCGIVKRFERKNNYPKIPPKPCKAFSFSSS